MIQRMLISGSFAFSKSSLYIWKFLVHVLLKPGLKDFEHNLARMWNECNCTWFEHSSAFPVLGIETKTDLFQFCGQCWVFQICWHIECSTFPYQLWVCCSSEIVRFYPSLLNLFIYSFQQWTINMVLKVKTVKSFARLPFPSTLFTPHLFG